MSRFAQNTKEGRTLAMPGATAAAFPDSSHHVISRMEEIPVAMYNKDTPVNLHTDREIFTRLAIIGSNDHALRQECRDHLRGECGKCWRSRVCMDQAACTIEYARKSDTGLAGVLWKTLHKVFALPRPWASRAEHAH